MQTLRLFGLEPVQIVEVRLVLQSGAFLLFLQVAQTDVLLFGEGPLLPNLLHFLGHLIKDLEFRVLNPTGSLLDIAAQLHQTLLLALDAVNTLSLDVLNPLNVGFIDLFFDL